MAKNVILSVVFAAFGRTIKQRRIKMKEEMDRRQLSFDRKVSDTFTKHIQEGLKD